MVVARPRLLELGSGLSYIHLLQHGVHRTVFLMLAEYLSESEDDNEHLDAEDASGWISSDADEGSGDDLVACSQPGSWALNQLNEPSA